jgi:microcystin-dependent protein
MFRSKRADGTTQLSGNPGLAAYPIGAIYLSMSGTDPGELFGGTWEFTGIGRTLVGWNAFDPDFDSVGEYGGSKTVTLTEENLPPHVHGGGSYTANANGSHFHTVQRRLNVGASTGTAQGGGSLSPDGQTSTTSDGSHTHNVTGQSGVGPGTSTPVNNLPPYLVVHMWTRVA